MGRNRPGGGLSAVQQAAKFLGVSVLAGTVLAGIALPAVGAMGLAAKGSVQSFEELPADLTRPPLSQKTVVLDAEGGKIAEIYSRNRTIVPLEQISPHMRKAIVAIEDARFYEHGAVDLRGILRALNNNLEAGATTEGASTLTQQYVKNVFVEAAGNDPDAVAQATQQTIGRKIRELKYAIQLEQEFTKDEILENYLNITFFGQQAYGVEAASRRYFSKPAADLELHEAAMLAGLVQSPSRYDPINDELEAKKRRDLVLQRMAANGDVTQAEADAAKARELDLKVSAPKNGCITAVLDAGFFCDYVREEFLSNPVFGETLDERSARWDLGGLTITTTLRPQAQRSAVQAATNGAHADDAPAASVVQVEPGTGQIIAMAQSRPYGTDMNQNQTMLNLNVSASMGGATYGFQPGSTAKPIIAAAALEKGISPAKTFSTGYEIEVSKADFYTCDNAPSGSDRWNVVNESETLTGTWDMTTALEKSVNTYFVKLLQEAGLCESLEMAEKVGVRRGQDDQPLEPNASNVLGAMNTTPLMMANAYATFAARGTYCEPVAILSVTDADGQQLPVPQPDCRVVMAEHNADLVNAMLKSVMQHGSGSHIQLGRDSGGKSGTTDDIKDVWFVGYTKEISTAVRVGGDTDLFPLRNITLAGGYVGRAGGGSTAGPIWREAMLGSLEGIPASSFDYVNLPRGNERGEDEDDEDEDDRDGGRGGNGGRDDNRPGDIIGGGTGGNGNIGGNAGEDGDWDLTWPDVLGGNDGGNTVGP